MLARHVGDAFEDLLQGRRDQRHVFARTPWYLWPLVPFALMGGLAVMAPLALLALLSIPAVTLYPDRPMHLWDVEGNDRQTRALQRWRAEYARLTFLGRVRRAWVLSRRRRARRHIP
jgi:hypothetical protein